jgi:hypothetical protein
MKKEDLRGTIAVQRMEALDFGNQMATFLEATNFGSNPGPTLESAWKPDPAPRHSLNAPHF